MDTPRNEGRETPPPETCVDCEAAKAREWLALTALKAARVVMDSASPPRKLAEALTWRENDQLARRMVDTAIAALERAK